MTLLEDGQTLDDYENIEDLNKAFIDNFAKKRQEYVGNYQPGFI